MAAITFPNYTQIPSRLSLSAWRAIRTVVWLGALVVAGLLIAVPDTGLKVFWKAVIPVLPVLFMVAPGVWRNICPLATSNQTPRLLGITKGLNPPKWLKEYGYVIAVSGFIGFVLLRKVGLDDSGPLSALLLLGAMTGAFAGGMVLKGKSGWCSTVCPLLPVQRIYGQTPFALVGNNHCQPCVGCAKSCYDFNPRAAYLADLNDADGYWSGYRKFFVGAFPGLILGFFETADNDVLGMLLYMAVSTALFALAITFIKVSAHTITSTFGAIAFGIFYFEVAAPARAGHVADPRGRDRARRRLARAHVAQGEAVPGPGRGAGRRGRRRRRRQPLDRQQPRAEVRRARGPLRRRRQDRARQGGPEPARDRRVQRDDDRVRLPHGHLRCRPGGDQGRHGLPEWHLRRREGHARTARLRAQHAHGLLRPRPRSGRPSRSSPTRPRRRASARSRASTTTRASRTSW